MAIIASGPSVKQQDVNLLKDRLNVFAIKKNVELAPWADAVYGCDFPWWRSVRGLPDFKGWKFAYAPKACDQFGLRRVEIPDIRESGDHLRLEPIGHVGAGGNSGFHAINLAVQFGVKRILLMGFDCQDRSGVHWYGRNMAQGQSNPSHSNFRRWIKAFANIAPELKDLGVEVVNASPISDVKAFPRWSVRDALGAWNL